MRFIPELILFALLTSPTWGQVSFSKLEQTVIESRLKLTTTKNNERQTRLKILFQEAGCGDKLVEQQVKGSKLQNVICTLGGESDEVIVVGAHFDQVDAGKGIVDNWSGASLLASLYQSLKTQPRKHTIIFIGFCDEEKGMVGSRFYADHLPKPALQKINAMVNMDTLGLAPTEVWLSHADKGLASAMFSVAKAMSLPVSAVNVDKVGTTDSESFAEKKIPSITIHSLTQETLRVLHSQRDDMSAIKMNEYYDSYRLIAGYLAYLDHMLGTPAHVN